MNVFDGLKRTLPKSGGRRFLLLAAVSALCTPVSGQASDDYGPAVWYPTSCTKYYTSGYGKQLWVVHFMQGYYHTLVSWQNNCAITTSAAYAYNTAKQASGDPYGLGEIGQFVRDANYAYTARCWNKYAIQCEHEGFVDNPVWFSEELYRDSAALAKSKAEKFGFAKDRNHFIGHNEGNGQNPAWEAWSEANITPAGTFDAHCNTHSDPGAYWDWNKYMSYVNETAVVNPPYLFDADSQGWTVGNGLGSLAWTVDAPWTGCIYADQTGNDGFFYSPTTSYTGGAEESVNVSLYPQGGSSASHDMQLFFKTAADNTWTAGKSSPLVTYTGQNVWVDINLDLNNAAWNGWIVNQWRLDVDNTSVGTRWIVNHLLKQTTPRYYFTSGTDSWTAGNGVVTPWWTDSGWPGILVVDQNAHDGHIFSPAISGFRGARNDRVEVRVYPQGGSSINHDLKLYWKTGQDNTWSDSKSTPALYYAGNDAWTTLTFDVGSVAGWSDYTGQDINQLRLDFDQVNHGNRFLVDYVKVIHDTDATPRQINSASLVGITAPTNVIPGQTFSATVTMKVEGSRPWSVNGHKLGSFSPANNTTWGLSRVGVAGATAPGNNYVFTFNATAPVTPGTYAFDWKMLEEGVEWFGHVARTNIAVHVPAVRVGTARVNNRMVMTWNASAGQACWVQVKTNLQDPWYDLTNVTAEGPVGVFTNAMGAEAGAGAGRRFYRLRIGP